MNCCRLMRHFASGSPRFSAVLHIGKHRADNHALFINSGTVRSYYNGCRLLESFRTRLRKGLRQHGTAVWSACCNQAHNVAVHRVWRGQQSVTFHLKLWGCGALTGIVASLVLRIVLRTLLFIYRCVKSKGDKLLLSTSGAFVYDWKNKISEDELTKYIDEIDAALCLKKRTFEINQPVVTTSCTCDGGKANHGQFERKSDPWSTFLVLPHLFVWKRETPNHKGDGLFEYKVYGRYTDVTALDFMAVNIDTMYRKMWDTGAVNLEILETDTASKSDVIYWEMAWPRMMNNRDYVYMRRYFVDTSKKVIVILNQNATHPEVPPLAGKERISEYWSIIVIKPITELNEPGIEFTMTYFDNPGANVPASITLWASATAFPDFHKRLHTATVEYASKKKDIVAFTKAEEEKESVIKRVGRRPVKEKCAPPKSSVFGGSWSSFDDLMWQFEEECREEEEEAQRKDGEEEAQRKDGEEEAQRKDGEEEAQRKDGSSSKAGKTGCVIRKKEQYLYTHYSWIVTS